MKSGSILGNSFRECPAKAMPLTLLGFWSMCCSGMQTLQCTKENVIQSTWSVCNGQKNKVHGSLAEDQCWNPAFCTLLTNAHVASCSSRGTELVRECFHMRFSWPPVESCRKIGTCPDSWSFHKQNLNSLRWRLKNNSLTNMESKALPTNLCRQRDMMNKWGNNLWETREA